MDSIIMNKPQKLEKIEKKCAETGFNMPSDLYVGSLLKTLIASKPKSNLLELGTGIGLSLAWMVEGMDQQSKLTTIDNDSSLIDIAKNYFGQDERVNIICDDGGKWLENYEGEKFDLIFADAWPGKYSHLNEALEILKIGGLYIIDDMTQQPNWPEDHQKTVDQLIDNLDNRPNLSITKMNWSTGLIIAVKTS
ncbi:O-methyltransferase [Aureibacter tunicatorum]|uniref:O-methyltransferase YrrM n=1 Tax=Aureibacter tunicatorum TaxID=866807 RepID=A0AAE3XLE5_9BACT|nr:class I SAM-dependent methyltransferase [Aureibacter tunicatorum]MDR6238597.1 putative O-methyltransferase YrrM [Aureibacter tunicatorum]BDD05472.1 hypothetical protein AUTU_29550 [Aureibacter tunicatorum]